MLCYTARHIGFGAVEPSSWGAIPTMAPKAEGPDRTSGPLKPLL